MDSKNKKNIGSIAGFMSILMFYIMSHSSPYAKLIMIGVFVTIILLVFIQGICTKKLGNSAGPMFILLLMGVVAMLGNYLDLKNIDDNFLLIIAAILFLALPIMTYRTAVKSGDVESIRKSKQFFVKISLAIGLMIVGIIVAIVFK
ncbi:hypothetical protein [Clostridium sp. JS66]|uniref:hypothetical protein n=1 Tax=Clostridium sp. JS66 TaxID=3064705 RepID=UPI00298E97A0|nr:hypothetical protein [Clostridium sp. JS66]WPC41627.1 hypothetical protein Q6H37_27800 [Clostridium sp. JS66]